MRKPGSTEGMLQKLSTIRAHPDSECSVEVGTFRAHGRNRLAAKAAGVIGKPGIADLVPDPVSAFNRLMKAQNQDKSLRRNDPIRGVTGRWNTLSIH